MNTKFLYSLFFILAITGCSPEYEEKTNEMISISSLDNLFDCNELTSEVQLTEMLIDGEIENICKALSIDFNKVINESGVIVSQINSIGLESYLNLPSVSDKISLEVKDYLILIVKIGENCYSKECIVSSYFNLRSNLHDYFSLPLDRQIAFEHLTTLMKLADADSCNSAQSRDEDDLYCILGGNEVNLSDECGRNTFTIGAVLGGLAGWGAAAWILPAVAVAAPPLGAVIAVGVIAGTIISALWNPANCDDSIECDDCHHPVSYNFIYDYDECIITAVIAQGAFEFAEQWQWQLQTVTGEQYFATTTTPRLSIPQTFNVVKDDFFVHGWTVCDGGTYPVFQYDLNTGQPTLFDELGYRENYVYDIPNQLWFLNGFTSVDIFSTVRYESSHWQENLVDPIWNVDECTIINQGFENGKYFIVLSFGATVKPEQEIILSLFDQCSGKRVSKAKTITLGYV